MNLPLRSRLLGRPPPSAHTRCSRLSNRALRCGETAIRPRSGAQTPRTPHRKEPRARAPRFPSPGRRRASSAPAPLSPPDPTPSRHSGPGSRESAPRRGVPPPDGPSPATPLPCRDWRAPRPATPDPEAEALSARGGPRAASPAAARPSRARPQPRLPPRRPAAPPPRRTVQSRPG